MGACVSSKVDGLYICSYICMYAYIYIHTHTNKHTYLHTCAHKCLHHCYSFRKTYFSLRRYAFWYRKSGSIGSLGAPNSYIVSLEAMSKILLIV
jgi:hypothetical protein